MFGLGLVTGLIFEYVTLSTSHLLGAGSAAVVFLILVVNPLAMYGASCLIQNLTRR